MEEDDITYDDLDGFKADEAAGKVAVAVLGGAKILLVAFFFLAFIAGLM